MEATIYSYLRHHAGELGARILEMYPPLQSTTDDVPANLSTLLRKPLPAQAVAIGGLAKHLKTARAARIVAECGAGKTFMALGLAHVLGAKTILVMCPSHIAKKWAREAIKTIPSVRTFLMEDIRNGGDPKQPHGVCEVRLRKGKAVYEACRSHCRDLREMGRAGWKRRCAHPSVFIIPKDKGKLSYFWRHAGFRAYEQARRVVGPAARGGRRGGALPAQACRDRARHSGVSNTLLLSDGLFAAHASAG